jgi:hypothetical protein
MWEIKTEFVGFSASQCITRVFDLRLQLQALLPAPGPPNPQFYILAIRTAWYASCSEKTTRKG